MKEKRSNTSRSNTKRHTRRVRLWTVLVVLILVGAAAWVLYDGGIIGAKNAPVATTPAAAVATETPTSAPDDMVVPDVASVESEDTDLAVIQYWHSADAQKMPNCSRIWPHANRRLQTDCAWHMANQAMVK